MKADETSANGVKSPQSAGQFASSIERSWYQATWWSWLLVPFSLLFAVLSAFRRLCFKLGLMTSTRIAAPVIIVGNISVGGTGKTPFTLWLCRYLQQQGLKPGILSRGYGVKIREPQLVTSAMSAAVVGDEPLLLAQLTGVPVVVCPKRVSGAEFLLANTDCNIVICDDGLQHYALARDLEIVLIDGLRGLGNGWLLPAGPLREGAWRLAAVDLVLSNSAPSPLTPYQLDIIAAPAKPLNDTSSPLSADCTVALVSGIGNPERFASTAKQAGFHIGSQHFFPDHHPFVADDFQQIPTPLLMTAKDAVKCQPFAKPNWYYLPITAQVPVAAEQVLWQNYNKSGAAMAFNIALLDIVACPLCKGKLKLDKQQQRLICTFDRLAYPIKQDIPVLLSQESQELSAAEVEPWLS